MTLAPKDKWLDKLAIEPSGCWSHSNRVNKRGYLRMTFGGRSRSAHQVIYEWLVGPIPDGLELDHLCRNRRCLNPSHLEPVTQQENLFRGESFTAVNARKTHCPRGHPYDSVALVKRRNGRRPARRCLTCGREQMRGYRKKKRDV